jgi:hypothetical protein
LGPAVGGLALLMVALTVVAVPAVRASENG